MEKIGKLVQNDLIPAVAKLDDAEFAKLLDAENARRIFGLRSEADSIPFLKLQSEVNEDNQKIRYYQSAPIKRPDGKVYLMTSQWYDGSLSNVKAWLKNNEARIKQKNADKFVHETAKTSSDIDWEPAVEGKPQFGMFTDIRDGQKYKCFKIGNQVWMAENLRYEGGWATVEGSLENLDEGLPERFLKEGESLKYTWAAVMNMPSCMNKIALPLYDKMVTEGYESSWNSNDPFKGTKYQGIAPIGWHIPSVSEFMVLKENIKNKMAKPEEDAEKLMGGLFEDGVPYEEDDSVSRPVWLWTVNETGSDSAVVFITTGWENRPLLENKSNHYFLRCIKNAD
jgi:uncharacterized protein (TIGR02145 family)